MRPRFRKFLKAMRLRPEDATHARRFTRALFLLGACTSLGTVAAESLLIGRAGASYLPVAFMANQAAILLVAAAYLRWGRDARADLPFRALGLIAALLATFSGFEFRGHEVTSSLLLFAVVHATSAMLLVHFHNVRGLLMDAQTTKVVLPRILPFFLVGKVGGGLLAALGGYVDTPMWGPIYGLSVAVTGWALAQPFRNVAAPAPPPVPGIVAIGYSSLWRNPFPRWALIATFVIVLVERTTEMGSGALLAANVQAGSLAKVLGWFTAVAAVFAGAAQAFVVAPLVAHFGPARMAILFPVGALVALIGGWFVQGLAAALLLRFAFAFLPPATVDPTYGLLEGSLPVRLARNVRVLKTGLMRPIATLLIVVAAAMLTGWALHAAVVFSCVSLALALMAPRLYARACLELVKDRGTSRADLRSYKVPAVEKEIWREAGRMLTGEDLEGADAALDLVEATGTPEAVKIAAGVLHDTRSSTVKARTIEVLGRLGWRPDAKLLAGLGAEAPIVRAEVYLCRGPHTPELDLRALNELERETGNFARVAAAGYRLAVQRGDPELVRTLSQALQARSASRVRLALRAVHRAGGGGVPPELVVEASRRKELRVRRASIGPLRLMGRADRLEEMARTDLAPLVRGAAFEALHRLDPTAAKLVAPRLLADPSSRVREPVGKVLLAEGRAGMRVLRRLARDPHVRWSIREEALITIAKVHVDSPFHARIGEAEAHRASWLHELRNQLPERSRSVGMLLSRALIEDEVVISIYLSLRAMTTRLGEMFFDALVEAIRSPRRAVRAQGLETLASQTGAPPEELIVLVRKVDYLARLQIGSSMPGEPLEIKQVRDWGDGIIWLPEGAKSERSGGPPTDTPETRDLAGPHIAVLREVLPKADPYLSAALLWALADLGVPDTGESLAPEIRNHPIVRETLDWVHSRVYPEGMPTLARLAFLKGTELFVGFGAEELHLVAQVAHSETFEPGEPLFRQGDSASELHVIVRGHVRIQLEHAGSCTVLDTLGPEDMLGEQGVFDGQPRSASAVAIEPVETLSLTRSDLTELLAQSPAVALAFLRTLSLRLRRASQQLAAARAPVAAAK